MLTREKWFTLLNEEQRIKDLIASRGEMFMRSKLSRKQTAAYRIERESLEAEYEALRTKIAEEIERDPLMRLINQFKVDE